MLMAIDEEFRRFKQIREELSLTQAAFAEELGISATTADIERGRTRIFDWVAVERYFRSRTTRQGERTDLDEKPDPKE